MSATRRHYKYCFSFVVRLFLSPLFVRSFFVLVFEFSLAFLLFFAQPASRLTDRLVVSSVISLSVRCAVCAVRR